MIKRGQLGYLPTAAKARLFERTMVQATRDALARGNILPVAVQIKKGPHTWREAIHTVG